MTGHEVVVETVLFDIGVTIVSATLLALVARALKQPMIAGYILAGILIGPEVLGIVANTEIIRLFAELGIAFLLFIVGLELDVSRLNEVRQVVVGAALAEVMLMFGVGFWLMFLLGFDSLTAVYVGVFIAFSSTAVLVKMLSDTGDIDTLHGRMTLGILLIQDILVILAISVLASLSDPSLDALLSSLLKGAGLTALAVVSSKYLIGHFLALIEDNHELVFLSSLTVLFLFVGLSLEAGLSTAVGGFLAGVALSAFPYNMEIAERARTMRDFFVTIFFVSLGMLVSLGGLWALFPEFLLLLGAVLLLKPAVVNLMSSLYRYGKQTSFYTGSSLAQVSEFSMVVALMGLSMGHIGKDVFSLVTALMVVTISITPYILKHQQWLYEKVERLLVEFEGARYEEREAKMTDHIVVIGAHRKGRTILQHLREHDEDIVVIDYDPEIIRSVPDLGATPVYGNIEDPNVLERANIGAAETIISTIPGEEDNRFLLNYLQHHDIDATIIVSADSIENALLLYEEGADYVLYPQMLAAQEAADIVEQLYQDGVELTEARESHIELLEDEYEDALLDRVEPGFVKQLKKRIQRDEDDA